jgi:hypothetical protein
MSRVQVPSLTLGEPCSVALRGHLPGEGSSLSWGAEPPMPPTLRCLVTLCGFDPPWVAAAGAVAARWCWGRRRLSRVASPAFLRPRGDGRVPFAASTLLGAATAAPWCRRTSPSFPRSLTRVVTAGCTLAASTLLGRRCRPLAVGDAVVLSPLPHPRCDSGCPLRPPPSSGCRCRALGAGERLRLFRSLIRVAVAGCRSRPPHFLGLPLPRPRGGGRRRPSLAPSPALR